MLWTIITPCSPLVALDHSKVGTMTCKGPAIVECPYCTNIIFLDIFEKHRDINVPSVQIMKVNNIRLQLIYFLKKFPCLNTGKTAIGEQLRAGVARFFI